MSRIISNFQVRPMFQLAELDTKTQTKIRKEFDSIDFDDSVEMVFQYQGEWYCLSQFCRLEGELLAKGWQGYLMETVWSSMIIKIVNSCTDIIVGRYLED
jgi:hypothetical protein